jgi:formate hydrogenlyase subunit 6/NADH:ubiquinone oxidoreductase subunit I
MTDVYQKLAKHLDNLPAGFPATESGVELRILKRLFTPEEAEMAMKLSFMPAQAADIAKQLGKDEADVENLLYQMSKKGLINRSTKGDRNRYLAAQFVVGIWEYHVNDLDEGLIRDFNEYAPHLMEKSWLKNKTKQFRVVPVSKSISAEIKVMPYEEAERIIREQKKIVVAPCICRKEHSIIGKPCDKPSENCLSFGGGAYFYEENGIGRSISQEEAIEILHKGIDAGLVIQPGNSQKPVNMCLCCGCCCQVLKNIKTLDEPAKTVNANYYAAVNEENCIACGVCADRCQMDAIVIEDVAKVKLGRCIGCGLCVASCEYDAMMLKEKEASEKYVPPKTLIDTYMTMAKERGLI